MLEIKNLYKKYEKDKIILNNINYKFNDTGLYYIIGKSGSGKSTLLYLLALLDDQYEGVIKYNNIELRQLSYSDKEDFLLKNMSFSFQDFKINEMKTVKDILYETLEVLDIDDKTKENRIYKYLNKVGLYDKLNSSFANLSGGEKKRISLVRALIKDTPLLFVDEPISSLNKKLREKISNLLLEESTKRLVIIITHEEDDIIDNSTILKLIDGQLIEIQRNINNSIITHKDIKRKKYGGKNFIKNIFKSLLIKREYTILCISSFAIALFTFTISFLLSFNINDSLNSSLTNYMDHNTLVINKKENETIYTNYKTPDNDILNNMLNEFDDEIISIDDYYITDIDTIIDGTKKFNILFDNKALMLEHLEIANFIEYEKIDELLIDDKLIFQYKELDENELILGISESMLKQVYYLFTQTKIKYIDEKVTNNLINILNDNIVSLEIYASKNEWKYFLNYSYRICGFVITNRNPFICSNNLLFRKNFVNKVINFKEKYFDEDNVKFETPAFLEKEKGITLYPNKQGEFIEKFLKSKYSNYLTIKLVKDNKRFIKNDFNTYNRYVVYIDYISKLHLSDIDRFIEDNKTYIKSVDYSTLAYTYTSSLYISGFNKPFFFSKYKNKLIEIEGNYSTSNDNLGQLQSSSIIVDSQVFKADLLSSIDQTGVKFISNSRNKNNLIYGNKPNNNNEIAISLGLAKKLESDVLNVINMELHTLILDSVTQEQGKFINNFTFGSLNISGIYDSDEIAIYQSSLFPFSYLFSHSILDPSEICIKDVVLQVDLDNKDANYYLDEIRKYGDYKGMFPMLLITKEIQKTMNKLTIFFIVLSSISILVSFFLIVLSLFLIIEGDKKDIGILLTLGYRKKEIKKFYLCLSIFIGIISYIFSFIISLIFEKILTNQLNMILRLSSTSTLPYIISFIICIITTFTISFISIYPINKLTPKEAFLRC